MSSLTAIRDELRDSVTAASAGSFQAFSEYPEAFTPPAVFVAPDDPYIAYEQTDGIGFGEATLRHRLIYVQEAGTNEVQLDALGAAIVKLLRADLGRHQVESVGEPGPLSINGQRLLGVAVNVSTPWNPQEEP